jgi:hypothetical protein
MLRKIMLQIKAISTSSLSFCSTVNPIGYHLVRDFYKTTYVTIAKVSTSHFKEVEKTYGCTLRGRNMVRTLLTRLFLRPERNKALRGSQGKRLLSKIDSDLHL